MCFDRHSFLPGALEPFVGPFLSIEAGDRFYSE